MIRSFGLFVAILTLSAGTQVFPQTTWLKYIGNPVLNIGPPGAWDNSGARIDRIVLRDSMFQMWYTGYTGGEPGPTVFPRTGYATSPNGINWTKHGSNPILSEGPAPWDGEGSFRPYVIFSDSMYRMWYTGVGCCPTFRIGYASSGDGIAWTKVESANPVLDIGSMGSYDGRGVEHASVIGPDSSSGFKMWYQGFSGFRIGYATAPTETSWTKYPSNPVFNSYDVHYPRVISDGQTYGLWYSIGRTQPASVGYSTSSDGIDWTPNPENPVFRPGPSGTWDDGGLLPGDILFDGTVYHMWYAGNDGFVFRSGYAVSPKGLTVRVSTTDSVINSVDDTISVVVTVDDPAGLQFSAKILSGGTPLDTLELFDDGTHGDNLASDGVFANSWIPPVANVYSVDLELTLEDTLRFEMKNAALNLVTAAGNAEFVASQGYHLSHNFPNPFNPSTKIGFTLRVSSFTSLKVFDMLGREVATLVNEELKPGSHELTWDAKGFPSGAYFYTLTAGAFSETKKLLLLR